LGFLVSVILNYFLHAGTPKLHVSILLPGEYSIDPLEFKRFDLAEDIPGSMRWFLWRGP